MMGDGRNAAQDSEWRWRLAGARCDGARWAGAQAAGGRWVRQVGRGDGRWGGCGDGDGMGAMGMRRAGDGGGLPGRVANNGINNNKLNCVGATGGGGGGCLGDGAGRAGRWAMAIDGRAGVMPARVWCGDGGACAGGWCQCGRMGWCLVRRSGRWRAGGRVGARRVAVTGGACARGAWRRGATGAIVRLAAGAMRIGEWR